jgi:hypothetical protein
MLKKSNCFLASIVRKAYLEYLPVATDTNANAVLGYLA